jgi:hypothetical protein
MSGQGAAGFAALVLAAAALVLAPGCGKKNRAVSRPDAPTGPSLGTADSAYTFVARATDADGDSVAIRFDWGDGDTSEWSQWVETEDRVHGSHAWSCIGTFMVRAQAHSTDSTTSAWSDFLQVRMEPVALKWEKTFGGPGVDRGSSVQELATGGYAVTGYSGSFGAGGFDIWLIRTDPNGDTLWARTFGGADWDEGRMVQPTGDGGLIVAGQTASSGAGQTDLWLVKTDAQGNLAWNKTYGGIDYDGAYAVQQTRDGGYIATGYTWSFGAGHGDVWLVKADANGDVAWDRTYGIEADEEWGQSVQPTPDGGYIVVANTYPFSERLGDVWLIKTDSVGNKVWDRLVGGAGEDWAYAIRQTMDGGYVLAGYTDSQGGGGFDAWLVRIDADGEPEWDKTYGGAKPDAAAAVEPMPDGGFIIAGYTDSYGAGGRDAWLIRTDAHGDTLWTRTRGGEKDDEACSVQPAKDRGYIVAGITESYGAGGDDVWLIKTDAEGRVEEGSDEGRGQKAEARMQNGREQGEMTRWK